jgi:cell division protein FtsI (penicillin-binding protein 3)/stage V sporulation protein D (sporulation-specific penicillin-binding protein)
MNARFIGRVRVLTACIVLGGLIIVGRLYFLQIVQGKAYMARADAQFMEPASPLPDRDSIYFTDKDGNHIIAATLKSGFTLAVNPTKVTDAQALYTSLSGLIPLDENDFLAKATKPSTEYSVIADHLDTALGVELEQKQLPGVILAEDRWRYYPGGSLAAQEIGFVAYNGDEQEGRYGLEKQYQGTLNKTDDDLYANFFVQLFSTAQGVINGTPQSGDVITTIEPSVQAELERELVAYDNTWHPASSGGIIMDPQTGAIYAMAVSPTFDLNNFGAQTDPLIFANPLVQNVYEMGSIIKPLTMAAGIDSGVITATTTYDDLGCITVDTKPICNYDHAARGVIPMQQILSQSLNVGASFIATRMGPAIMKDYFLNHYDLGEATGIDMPEEQAGLVSNLNHNRQVDYDTAAFGQGIAITPMETIRGLATLANGGKLVMPHLASAIQYDTGVTKTLNWGTGTPVLKPSTVATVTGMLTTVVDTVLDNGAVKMAHYSIAAKTGTAQIVDPSTGAYYPDTYLHSYFGYLPANSNARFIIFLFALKPVGAPYASETWSNPFIDITRFLINYYNLPPDR